MLLVGAELTTRSPGSSRLLLPLCIRAAARCRDHCAMLPRAALSSMGPSVQNFSFCAHPKQAKNRGGCVRHWASVCWHKCILCGLCAEDGHGTNAASPTSHATCADPPKSPSTSRVPNPMPQSMHSQAGSLSHTKVQNKRRALSARKKPTSLHP